MSISKGSRKNIFVMQADAGLSQANPVSGTQYTVLATSKNTRIISIVARVVWTLQPTPLEVHVTIDGQTYTFSIANPATNTWCYAVRNPEAAENGQSLVLVANFEDQPFLLEGRSVAITAEITGGTVSSLQARARYARKEP